MTQAGTSIGSVVLATERMEEALAFYSGVLGFALTFRDGDEWAALDGQGVTVALAGPRERAADPVSLAVKVVDLDAALSAAVGGGATLVTGPVTGAHEIRAEVRDPDGHLLTLYTPVRG
jgi:catechol 2,3-dioxygenase-like lactoylglutathione lyase family enzyme